MNTTSVEVKPLLYTIKQTAQLLSVSEMHVRRMYWKGQLGYVKVGNAVRIPAAAIEKLLEGGKCA